MCRLFAFSFNQKTTKNSKVACCNLFRSLSQHGAVLPTSTPGHGDGWGITLYQDTERIPRSYKSICSANEDYVFNEADYFLDGYTESGLIHLRKKTVGDAVLSNTHPFTNENFSFIHNGTVSHGELYPSLALTCEGSTDSERLFSRFLEIKNKESISNEEAYKAMLKEAILLYPAYSALNTILHDGETIYVSRSINMDNRNYEESELLDYYTLYIGTSSQGDVLVSSEKIAHPETRYTLLPNHSISVISLFDSSIKTYQL